MGSDGTKSIRVNSNFFALVVEDLCNLDDQGSVLVCFTQMTPASVHNKL